MARKIFELFFGNVTCRFGSSERCDVQEGPKRTSKSFADARLRHICTLSRSFEPYMHVTFKKIWLKVHSSHICTLAAALTPPSRRPLPLFLMLIVQIAHASWRRRFQMRNFHARRPFCGLFVRTAHLSLRRGARVRDLHICRPAFKLFVREAHASCSAPPRVSRLHVFGPVCPQFVRNQHLCFCGRTRVRNLHVRPLNVRWRTGRARRTGRGAADGA